MSSEEASVVDIPLSIIRLKASSQEKSNIKPFKKRANRDYLRDLDCDLVFLDLLSPDELEPA